MKVFNKRGSLKEINDFKEMIKEIDKNGDGDISLNEFIEMMEKFSKK